MLFCEDGVMEELQVTNEMALMALTNYSNSKTDPDSFSVINIYNIEHVC